MRKLLIAVRPQVELYRPPDWFVTRLRESFPELTVVRLDGYEGIERQLIDAEIFVGWSLPLPKLALARRLKWIHSLMTGVGQLCYPELVASPIVLTNAAPVHAPTVAEHAWALILALSRRIPRAVAAQQRREWALQQMWDERPRPFDLGGRTLGLIGLGAIGREVAARGRAFGMRVVAVKRRPEAARDAADVVYGAAELDRLLAESDVIVLAAPATRETNRLLGEREFQRLKPGAVLVNISRGSLLDEAALMGALVSGRLSGAALDVTETEPLPPESPLWAAPNLLITPHLSAASENLWPRHFDLLAENTRRYLAGQELLCTVDKSAGY